MGTRSPRGYRDTPLGKRKHDFDEVDSDGNVVAHIEVKSGGSRYGGRQRAKDKAIEAETGRPTHVVYVPSGASPRVPRLP